MLRMYIIRADIKYLDISCHILSGWTRRYGWAEFVTVITWLIFSPPPPYGFTQDIQKRPLLILVYTEKDAYRRIIPIRHHVFHEPIHVSIQLPQIFMSEFINLEFYILNA